LGVVGYVNRERIGRWLSDEEPDPKERNQGRTQELTGVLETAESLKNLHGQLAPDELDKKHAELLDKLTAMNANVVSEFKGLINDVHEELGSMTENFQGELDAQRREVRALGKELREAMASLKARQDTVEALVRGNDPGEVFAVSGRQRTVAETPRRQEETGKKSAPNGSRRKGNGSTAPETRAP
jgi:peptidoglycan hydrolase CwlO-like protein